MVKWTEGNQFSEFDPSGGGGKILICGRIWLLPLKMFQGNIRNVFLLLNHRGESMNGCR